MSGDGPDKQMIDTAGAVADFAYRQGVSDAIAVDHLIQRYRTLREADTLLRKAMAYVRAFGASGSAPVVVDREALDRASDDLLKRYDAYLETSDAVRERPIRHLPVNGPDDRQPNAPSTEAGRRAATAGGHSSEQDREKP